MDGACARTGEQIQSLRSANKSKISAPQAYRRRPQFLSGYIMIRASPGLQSGEAHFQTRENALSCNYRALALVKNAPSSQSTRTLFVTSTTVGRRALLQSDRMAERGV
jgi:hypothetical protein